MAYNTGTPISIPLSHSYHDLKPCHPLSAFHTLKCRHIVFSLQDSCSTGCLDPGPFTTSSPCPICSVKALEEDWQGYLPWIFAATASHAMHLSDDDFLTWVGTCFRDEVEDRYRDLREKGMREKQEQCYELVMSPESNCQLYNDFNQRISNLPQGTTVWSRDDVCIVDRSSLPEFRVDVAFYDIDDGAVLQFGEARKSMKRLWMMRSEINCAVTAVNAELAGRASQPSIDDVVGSMRQLEVGTDATEDYMLD